MSNQNNTRHEIETLIQNRANAVKNQDIEKAVSDYTDDIILFDIVGELGFKGIEAVKERLTTWFGTMQKMNDYKSEIINIAAEGSTGYCNNFNHVVAILKDGNELNMFWRETLGLTKTPQGWKISTAHSSVPFDAKTGMGSTGLKPPAGFH